MERRALGRSGLVVGDVGLGCWAIGGPSFRDGNPVGWSGSDDADSLAGLRRGMELGVTHLDTADVYGDGHSERLIGRALSSVDRDAIVVASKAGFHRGTAEHPMEARHLRNQLEQSLTNLRTDRIDLYYLHNADFGPDDRYLDGAARVLQEAKSAGKIRVIGQSALTVPDLERTVPVTGAEVVQFHFNALSAQDGPDRAAVIRWADERDLGLVMFSPIAQGLLLDKFHPDRPPVFTEGDIRGGNPAFTRDRLVGLRDRLAPLKERFGATTADLLRMALQYCLAQSTRAVVIPGFKDARQVEADAAVSGKPLSTEDVAFIDRVLAP